MSTQDTEGAENSLQSDDEDYVVLSRDMGLETMDELPYT